MNIQTWTRESVIDELIMLSKNGYAPSGKKYPSLYCAAKKLFGDWNSALKEAGLVSKGKIPKKKIISKTEVSKEMKLKLLKEETKIYLKNCYTCKYNASENQTYCIEQCKIGQKLQAIGRKLEGE